MPKLGMEPIRRQALIEAVIHEIGARGTMEVTVSQISQRAGMSSALAHHYFGSKEQILAAAMRHVLTLHGAGIREALAGADTPHARIAAIVRASFGPDQFRPEMIAVWLNLYVLARKSAPARRLLHIYQQRLHSNLKHDFRRLAPGRADMLARGTAAMIDGFYLRQALKAEAPDAGRAIDAVLYFVNTSLAQEDTQ